ncbi:PDZ domain-containing protein [Streptomyces sp. NPDC015532]|uniref:PDZ domain-containing protein n=1 Tax=Streptomyces sp. NPDC015532 TaxID=3364960 RepID=UPI00370355A6
MEHTALRPKPMPGGDPSGPRPSRGTRRPGARVPDASRRRGRRLATLLTGVFAGVVLVLSGVGLGAMGATVIGVSGLADLQKRAGASGRTGQPSAGSEAPRGAGAAGAAGSAVPRGAEVAGSVGSAVPWGAGAAGSAVPRGAEVAGSVGSAVPWGAGAAGSAVPRAAGSAVPRGAGAAGSVVPRAAPGSMAGSGGGPVRPGESERQSVHGTLGVEAVDAHGGAGALIVGVRLPGPGYSAGLVRGDTLLALDGTGITSAADLARAVADARPGREVTLRVRHANGSRGRLSAVPGTAT